MDTLRSVLGNLIRLDPTLIGDVQRCMAALRQQVPDAPARYSEALEVVQKEGIPAELSTKNPGHSVAVQMARARKRLVGRGLREDLAQWAVESWAEALGIEMNTSRAMVSFSPGGSGSSIVSPTPMPINELSTIQGNETRVHSPDNYDDFSFIPPPPPTAPATVSQPYMTADPGLLHTFARHTDWVTSVAFSPRGRFAFSASRDNVIRIFDAHSNELLKTLEGSHFLGGCCAFSPDRTKAVLSARNGAIELWDIEKYRRVRIYPGHDAPVTALVISQDGRYIISGARDGSVQVWDLNSGNEVAQYKGHQEPVASIALAPDGVRVVSMGDLGPPRLWLMTNGREIRRFENTLQLNQCVALSPDGRRAALGSADPLLRIYDTLNGHEICVLEGHEGAINAIAYSPDGRLIVTASDDKNIIVWDVGRAMRLHTFTGHTGRVLSLAITPDSALVLSGSRDQTMKLWRLPKAPPPGLNEEDTDRGSIRPTLFQFDDEV